MSAEGLAWELPGGGRALFTDRSARQPLERRRGGTRAWGGRPASASAGPSALGSLARGFQVHGSRVRRLYAPPPRAPAGGWPRRGRRPGHRRGGHRALVLTADCLPVALAAEGAVAMVHAGWRGLAGGRARGGRAALRELGRRAGHPRGRRARSRALLLRGRPEVHAALRPGPPRGSDLDLRAARPRASRARRASRRSLDVEACTICDERFFSHRREGARAGRQAGRGVAELIHGLSPSGIAANLARIEAEVAAAAIAGRAAGRARGSPWRSSRRPSTCPGGAPRARPGGGGAGRGEPRPGPARRRWPPTGSSSSGTSSAQLQSRRSADRAPRTPDPLPRLATPRSRELARHRELARPGLARPRSRSTWPARRARRASPPRELDAFIEASADARRGADDDAAAHPRPRGRAAPGSPRCGSWRPSGAFRSSRWAPPRTTSSPPRRAPQSCESARVCTLSGTRGGARLERSRARNH